MSAADFETVSPADIVQRRKSGELWQLLDVREPWELKIASVSGSVAMPMAEVPGRLGESAGKYGIAVLCHTGVRSAAVARWLSQQGFEKVANVAGGIDAWSVEVDATIPRY